MPLTGISRIPVCGPCLSKPVPVIADYYCSACRTPFLNPYPLDEQGLCGLCRRGLTGFDAAYSFGSYEGELRELIHVFKYRGVETLARPLGKLLLVALPLEQRFDAIVPMPLHWRKQWRRGFNQSALLAREVSRRWKVPLRRLVKRIKNTSAQAGLTSAKRRDNVSGAFRVKGALEGLRLLLVDDVMTTGATAGACAAALKRAGAAHVTLLTLARADRRLVAVALRDRVSVPESTILGSFEDAKSGSIA
jgi:ComF family protein